MLHLGDYNTLEVARLTEHGAFLHSADGDVLLPGRYVPAEAVPGGWLEVFVYRDSEDRLVATTQTPFVRLGGFAALNVRDVTNAGAWLDWGLDKDLLLPWRQQREPVQPGDRVVVVVYLDTASDRLAASSRLTAFLDPNTSALQPNQPVGVLVVQETELGYSVVLDRRWAGVLYRNEVFRRLLPGDELPGYVRRIRPDGKVDAALQASGYDAAVAAAANDLLIALRAAKGRLPLTDNSAPDVIYRALGMSKKLFKKALGLLYRQGQVQLTDTATLLVEAE